MENVFKKITSESSFFLISNFITVVFTLLLQIVTVRSVNAYEYGSYVAALAVVQIIMTTIVVKTGELALHHLGHDWEAKRYGYARKKAEDILYYDIKINLIVFTCMIIFAPIIANILHVDVMYFRLLSILIPLQSGYGVFKALFIVTKKLKRQSGFEAIFGFSQGIAGCFGVYFWGIYGLIGSLILIFAGRGILAYFLLLDFWNLKKNKEQYEMKGLWTFSFHSVVSNLLSNTSGQVDILLLTQALPASELALYKVAKTLANLPGQAFAAIWIAVRPHLLTACHNFDQKKALKLVGIPATLIFCVLILVVPILYFLMPHVLEKMYGSSYIAAESPFFILFFGMWVWQGMTSWFRFWVILENELMLGTILNIISLIISVMGGFIWGCQSIDLMASVMTFTVLVNSLLSWLMFIKKINQWDRNDVKSK